MTAWTKEHPERFASMRHAREPSRALHRKKSENIETPRDTHGHIRDSWMFSCTTVDSILLSGLGGMAMTPVEASTAQPSFVAYSSSSAPVKSHPLVKDRVAQVRVHDIPAKSRYVPSLSRPIRVNAALTALMTTCLTESSNPTHSTV